MKNILRKSLAVILCMIMVLLTFVMSVSAAEGSAIDQSKLKRYHVTSERFIPLSAELQKERSFSTMTLSAISSIFL